YLPPLSLGQPGTQTGSVTSQLGTGGNNYFFMRTEGWSTDRQQGDAFTPNPAGGALGVSSDVHAISATQGSDTVDGSLPSRNGYSSAQQNLYSTMEYTVFVVNTPFIRASDQEISKVKVYPIDATGYYLTPSNCGGGCAPAKNYNPIDNLGGYITQQWDAAGNPVNMQTYHAWVDLTNYTGAGDGGTFQRLVTPAGGMLPPGQYRMRVDTLGFDGTNPPTNGISSGVQAHKAYAVRVLD